MAVGSLIRVRPISPVTGECIDVLLTDVNDRAACALGGNIWLPGLTEAPKLGISLFNGDFQSAITPAAARFSFNLGIVGEELPEIDDLIWPGAPVEILSDAVGAGWPWRPRFRGVVKTYGGAGRTFTLNCEVDTEALQANVLTKTYAGTTGAEGPLDLKGRVKPLVIGWARNVEPVLINATDSVYQFSAYGPIEAASALFEKGSDFGASSGNHATYAALVAATIPRGGWATCLAEGMVRLGAPQAGLITGDVRGHAIDGVTPRLTGAIITLLADLAEIDPARLVADTLANLDEDRPYPCNVVQTEQATFLDMARALAMPLNYQAGVNLLGNLFVTHPDLEAAPTFTLHAQGRALPEVTADVEEQFVSPPYHKITMGAQQCWRVHSFDEIGFASPFVPMGLYVDTDQYREGMIVSLPDGSEWLYINAAPTTGNDPPVWPVTSNAWWSNIKPPLTADNLTYVDGTPIEDLKPAEPDADVTIAVTGSRTVQVAYDYTGAAKINQLPVVIAFKLIAGAASDVTTSAVWSATLKSGTATFTIGAATGILNVTVLSVDAVIEVKAVYNSKDRFGTATLLRVVDAAPGGGSGGGSSDSSALEILGQGDTYGAAAGRILTVTAGGTGKVSLTADCVFWRTTNGTSNAYGKFQWRAIGGSFADAASETISSSPAVKAPDDDAEGVLLVNVDVTGLTAATAYEFQFLARSATAAINLTGTQTGVGS